MNPEEPENIQERITAAATTVAEALDADVLLYNADMERANAAELRGLVASRPHRSNVALILVTYGGDPDAAYMLGRCLQQHYKKVMFLIPGMCKSAGTLAACAANELIISDSGELGPFDIQIAKHDDMFALNSGLTATSALEELRGESFNMFERTFLQIKRRSHGQVSFKLATEIAVNLTVGLFAPIYSQIQAMHIGDAGRANLITRQYGQRLAEKSGNVKPRAIGALAFHYPTHRFVIDRAEAQELFVNVRCPSHDEQRLFDLLGDLALEPLQPDDGQSGYNQDSDIRFLSPDPQPQPGESDESDAASDEPRSEAGRTREVPEADERRALLVPGDGASTETESGSTVTSAVGNGSARV